MREQWSRLFTGAGVLCVALFSAEQAAAQTSSGTDPQKPVQTVQAASSSSLTPVVEDPLASYEKRLSVVEEWKTKVERLPLLSNKVNFGLNALQFLYTHQDAKTAEGRSQDNFSIRRSELLAYGKINEFIPKWHVLFEFQSINLTNNTPDCSNSPGGNCSAKAGGVPTAATFFRESYIDFRPFPSLAPNLNFIRMGIFRMPFGIFTETSGGLRDVISSPYLTSVGSGGTTTNGTGGPIELIHERDYFVDMRGTLFNKLDYVGGIMNNNNYQANILGGNGPKVGYGRLRYFFTDISFVSMTVLGGESNNTGTFINGRGKGSFDRYGLDARYTSRWLPGFMIQGEVWQGHDGSNPTIVGTPAQGDCLNRAFCGGSGAPGVQRRTWYVLAKYLISSGPLKDFEPVVMYEQFDPNTAVSNDMFTRTIVGFNYYFENLPPKIQSKLSVNYEFRHHQGTGPATTVANNDPFAQNAFLVQFQIRYQ
ncbi:MAG: hypothetical protein KF814_13275 [Nitrospiraceae bacterium]|nr:hypothetical protein [Nitrospiraceae bacterium]